MAANLGEDEATATKALFAALGNPARVRIVNLLAAGDGRRACATCSSHSALRNDRLAALKRLVEAGLVVREEREVELLLARPGGVRAGGALAATEGVLLMATGADELREVRRRYAESARAVVAGSSGCGSSACSDGESDAATFGQALYDAEQRGELPGGDARVARLRQPTAVADLLEARQCSTWVGGRIDVILSARRDRTERDRLWRRHDRRDARARSAERARRQVSNVHP